MRLEIELGRFSSTISFNQFHSTRHEATLPLMRLMLAVQRPWCCLDLFWNEYTTKDSKTSSSECLQLCLGAEFCHLLPERSKDKTSTSNSSQCLTKHRQQPLPVGSKDF